MNKEDKNVEWAARTLAAALLVALVWALSGCSHRYIPVESVRYDSIFFARIQKDSIFVQDSVYIKEKGDTVFVDKFKYIYKNVLKTDTLYISRTDSIQVPYPVEAKLTRWQKLKVDVGGYLLGIMTIYILFYIILWLIRKTRKRI